MQEIYDYDNSHFLNELREIGFVVAEASTANYPKTVMSLSSTLNLAYLDDLVAAAGSELVDFGPLRDLIRNSRLVRVLKRRGYSTAAFSSPYYNADLGAADVYLDSRAWWSDFEIGLISMTPVPAILGRAGVPLLYDLHRERILSTLEELPKVVELPGPKFVYAHLLAPHPPFVFGEQGNPVNPPRRYDISDAFGFLSLPGASENEYIEGYRRQLHFLNGKVVAIVRQILDRSPLPPIIVLQSDHGPGVTLRSADPKDPALKERFGILNAQWLPGGDQLVHDNVSSVNTFRIILKHQFGLDLEPLPDLSYVVEDHLPYRYLPVEADLRPQ